MHMSKRQMLTKRALLAAGAAAMALGMAATSVAAQEYPSKPIQMVVPFGQGGATDRVARMIAPALEEKLGGTIVIVNQPGAGGAVGLSNLARADGDGYIIGIGSDSTLGARPMMSDTGYNANSFKTIARIVQIPSGVAVRADSPYQNLNDLVEALKTERLTYSGSGVASGPHLAMAIFLAQNNVKATLVSSESNQEGLVKLLSGEVDFLTGGGSNFPDLFDENGNSDIRVLGLAAAERWSFMPEVPTYREQGFDYLRSQWFGLVAPADTPDEAVSAISAAVEDLVLDDAFRERLKEFFFDPAYLDPAAMRVQITSEEDAMRPILAELGLLAQ